MVVYTRWSLGSQHLNPDLLLRTAYARRPVIGIYTLCDREYIGISGKKRETAFSGTLKLLIGDWNAFVLERCLPVLTDKATTKTSCLRPPSD